MDEAVWDASTFAKPDRLLQGDIVEGFSGVLGEKPDEPTAE